MKLFNITFGKPAKKTADKATQSLYDYFAQSKEVLGAFAVDEKTIAEKTREVFQRSVFDMKYEVVSHDERGRAITTQQYAFDESVREKAASSSENKSAISMKPCGRTMGTTRISVGVPARSLRKTP